MKILQTCSFYESGQLHYIVSVDTTELWTVYASAKIIHNNTVHTTSGSIGIPSITNTNFYSMYKK